MIEAIVEELEPKQELFAALGRLCRAAHDARHQHLRALGDRDRRALEPPEHVLGLHFFNPAPLMPLVEVVRAPQHRRGAFEAAFALGERSASSRCAATTRPASSSTAILIPLLNDCVRALDEAGATLEDLDPAMRSAPAGRWARSTLLDLVGIDVHVHAARGAVRGAARAADGAARRGSCAWPTPGCSAARRARFFTYPPS